MKDFNKLAPIIYGLEFQARALCTQTAELDKVRFLVGTQSLKFSNNQVHIVELNDKGTLKTQIFQHDVGEIWFIQASPTETDKFITCYNVLTENGLYQMKGTLWNIPKSNNINNTLPLQKLVDIDTTPYGNDLKTITYHPIESFKVVSVVDNNFILWDLNCNPQPVTVGTLISKGQSKFTIGKWNPHPPFNQFATLNENQIRGWDFRQPNEPIWIITSAHSQIIRDLDFNTLRQYYLATCGDDGYIKFWDIRNTNEPIISKMEHSHWIWSIRINRFHDQLVLTSSSDSRVILSSVNSISSEPLRQAITLEDRFLEENYSEGKLKDGVIAKYEEHEDSVYAVEWSAADPWTFASLSYDGRLVINKVPWKCKYQILL